MSAAADLSGLTDPKILDYKVQCKKVSKSAKKFGVKRQPLVVGKIGKAMIKRMEFMEEHKDEAKQTRKLMKVLGLDDETIIDDEEKIEEFIALRAINDTNVPKLHQTDTIIFKGIIDDIFPQSV